MFRSKKDNEEIIEELKTKNKKVKEEKNKNPKKEEQKKEVEDANKKVQEILKKAIIRRNVERCKV